MNGQLDFNLLFQEYLEGDIGSFERFYKQSYNDFYLYARHFEARDEVVKDLLQKFYLDIYEHPDKYRSTRNVRAYLLRSLRNLFLQERRDNGTRLRIHQQSAAGQGTAPSPETEFTEREEDLTKVRMMEMVLGQMTNREREVVYLRYYQGMSSKEVGAILRISPQVVRNLTYRGFRKVREKYNGRKILTEVYERIKGNVMSWLL